MSEQTVDTTAVETKQEEPKLVEPKNLIFCIPGRQFSGNFLQCWTELSTYCTMRGHKWALSQRYSSNVYYVRNMCLGGNVLEGPDQKPFGGKVDYDYMVWIDSDVLFNSRQFERLLSHDLPIVSGLYMMQDGKNFAAVENWNEADFSKEGTFKFLTPDDVKERKDPFKVSYSGFGFTIIKKGVFEQLQYPWFRPHWKTIGNAQDFTSEDVGFCLSAQEKGIDIKIDPLVILGHEKTVIL